jgi:hypothetical protein
VLPSPFQSFSGNGEDVVLWRVLRGVDIGRYIEVGANHPCRDSATMAFYKRGWTGITVELDPMLAALQRTHRPADIVVEAEVAAAGDTPTLQLVAGAGLSTPDHTVPPAPARSRSPTVNMGVPIPQLASVLEDVGWSGQDIHFLAINAKGSQRTVLESIDLTAWRPWVLLVRATDPNSTRSSRDDWEDVVLGAGYQVCLFDGISRFYVSDERTEQLAGPLSYPACIRDNYIPPALRECEERAGRAQELAQERAEEIQVLVGQVVRWRAEAVTRWATAIGGPTRELEVQQSQMDAELATARSQRSLLEQEVQSLRDRVLDLETSTSWRVTRPLRSASGLLGRALGRH